MQSSEGKKEHSQETQVFLDFLAQLGTSAVKEFTALGAEWCLLHSFPIEKDGVRYTARVGGVAVPTYNPHREKTQTSYTFTCLLTKDKDIVAVRRVWFADVTGKSKLESTGHVETFLQGKGLTRVVDSLGADILRDWSNRLHKTIHHSVVDLHSSLIRSFEQNMSSYPQMSTPENHAKLQKMKEQRARWLALYGPAGTSPLLQPFVPGSNEGETGEDLPAQ